MKNLIGGYNKLHQSIDESLLRECFTSLGQVLNRKSHNLGHSFFSLLASRYNTQLFAPTYPLMDMVLKQVGL